MFSQIILLAATAAIAPLASNAAPIFTGMFTKRADSNVQLAQGTNFFFSGLQFEAQCTPGQVACVRGNFATCSEEANWEVTPCLNNTSCFAIPNANNNVDVKCMSETDANNAITQAGGQGGVSVDFQVTEAPFPDANAPTDPNAPTEGTPTDGGEATPTSTDEAGAGEPTETCPPDDGSDDGSNEGDNGSGDGSEATPTGDVAETGAPTATPTEGGETCTDEPEETETITLILVPNPTESGAYITSTFTGGDLPEATGAPAEGNDNGSDNGSGSDATPTDAPTETAPADAAPTETCTETDGEGQGEDTGDYSYVDGPSDAPSEATDAPAVEPTPSTTERTTFTAPAPSPTSSDINNLGTHFIPVIPTKRSFKFRRF